MSAASVPGWLSASRARRHAAASCRGARLLPREILRGLDESRRGPEEGACSSAAYEGSAEARQGGCREPSHFDPGKRDPGSRLCGVRPSRATVMDRCGIAQAPHIRQYGWTIVPRSGQTAPRAVKGSNRQVARSPKPLSPVEAERIALAWAEREARQVSKKHPQNGPSLNKAPYKKEKPLTDAGLAAINKRKADADAEFLAKARSGRIFSQAMRDNGNCLPIVGPGAKKF
jgi:hypothetical protein